MKKSAIVFLQAVIVLMGMGTLALLLWEPWLEGVNAHATTISQIYFDDPFLALVYIGSVPLFIAFYGALRVLEYVRQNTIFSEAAVKTVRRIKRCAFAIMGFVAVEEALIILTHGNDDATGGIMLGVMIAFGSIVIATAAAMFERILQKAVDLQSENDLTV